MYLSSNGILTVALVALLVAPGAAAAQPARRIDTAEALSHLLKRVEPVTPAKAEHARVGGEVIADVTISPAGRVSSLIVVGGPELLHGAAERALRQWTFKPFVVNGKATYVRAILEVSFPDPAKDASDRIFEAYRVARYECLRQLDVEPAGAEAACAAAVRAADALPADRVLERSHELISFAHSLMNAGQAREAITHFERAREIRAPRPGDADADTADLHQIVGVLYQQLGDHATADQKFSSAIADYTAAAKRFPAGRERYAPRLKTALVRQAALKRLLGDHAAAASLESRAAAIDLVSAERPPARSARTTHEAHGLVITEPAPGVLTENDIQQIRSLFSSSAREPWRLDVDVFPGDGDSTTMRVHAYLTPEVKTPVLERGTCVMLTTLPPPGVIERQRTWRRVEATLHYIRVGASAEDPMRESVIRVQPASNQPLPPDDHLASLVRTIRAQMAPKATDRMYSDIQPWPITGIVVWRSGEVRVELVDDASGGRQDLMLRHADGQWRVIELRGIGEPPR